MRAGSLGFLLQWRHRAPPASPVVPCDIMHIIGGCVHYHRYLGGHGGGGAGTRASGSSADWHLAELLSVGLPTFRCFFTGAAGVSDRLLLSEESDDAELGELPELPELFDDELLFSEVSVGLPAGRRTLAFGFRVPSSASAGGAEDGRDGILRLTFKLTFRGFTSRCPGRMGWLESR